MKKFFTLLVGLVFAAILPSYSQEKVAEITSTVIKNSSELNSGYYIINCYIPKIADQDLKPSGSLYYNSGRNDRPFDVTRNGFIFEGESQINTDQANYIWYVSKGENGEIKIRNISQKIYFPKDTDRNNNMGDAATKAAEIFLAEDKTYTDANGTQMEGVVLVTQAQYSDNGVSQTRSIYANHVSDTDPNLSYWSRGDGEIIFQFVQVRNINFNIEYPFHTSVAPTGNEFDSNTRWQLLNIKQDNTYLYYTDENTNIKPNNSYTSTNGSVEDKYLWAFNVTPEGNLMIYNKAAGAGKVLAAGEMAGENGGGTFPNFVDYTNIGNQIATWNALKSIKVTGKDGFFLYRGENQAEKLNLRTVNGENVLSFWTAGADEGSTFWTIPYVNYTIKYVTESGEELQTPTNAYGVAGTDIALSAINGLVPKRATDNNGNELAIENSNITLPESYDCAITVTYANHFETTEIVDGSFAPDTKWYYLKLNGRYLSYNDTLENYNYKTTLYKEQKYVYSFTEKPQTYGCFWTFVRDGEDLKIYNAVTGTLMVLASQGSAERDYYPTMVAPGTDGYTDTWHYKMAKDSINFYLFLQGTTLQGGGLYDNKANKLNCFAGAMNDSNGGNPKNYLTFSTGDGDWSYFSVEEVGDITTTISSVRGQVGPTGAVGGFNSDESFSEFNSALEEGSVEGLAKALKIKDLTGTIIQFDASKYYRLQNVLRGGVLQINDEAGTETYKKLTQSNMNKANANMIWKIELLEGVENGVKLYHSNAKAYAGSPNNTSLNETGTEYVKVDWGGGNYGFKANGTSDYLVQYSGGGIGSWSQGGNGTDHAWYIIPAEEIDVNITEAGYTTVNYPFAVELPEGEDITAYFVTVIDNDPNNLMLRKVYSGHIPANTPVILKGTTNTYALSIVTEDKPTNISGNILKGTLLQETMGNGDIFVLSKPETKDVGFYLLNDADGANRTIPANKAYLLGEDLPTASQGVRGFTFSFEDSNDGTTNIENEVADLSQEEFYDLQGRRVQNPTKGIYITKSGKKVLFIK